MAFYGARSGFTRTTLNQEYLGTRLRNFDAVEFCGPVSETTIAAAERAIGVCFPRQYRTFLTLCGCGGIGSEDFIGLGGAEHLNIAKLAVRLRSRHNSLPGHLLPIRGDGFGNYDCLDTRLVGNDGECAVVQWNHEGGADQHCKHLADCYDSWFESMLIMMEER